MVWLLVGCAQHAAPTTEHPRNAAPHGRADERCGMVEAALRYDAIKQFACGTAATEHGRIVVDVRIKPPLRACASDLFTLYRVDQPMNTDALLQLSLTARPGDTWAVGAVFIDPPNSPGDVMTDGYFEEASYYCHVSGVRVTRTPRGWVAWHDPND